MKRLIAAGCLLFGFAATPLHAAEGAIQGDRTKSCRKEVWRVYVPSDGSKSGWWLRPQKRTVLVCNQHVYVVSEVPVSMGSGEGTGR